MDSDYLENLKFITVGFTVVYCYISHVVVKSEQSVIEIVWENAYFDKSGDVCVIVARCLETDQNFTCEI